jgi:hypothetical protein
MPKSALQDLSAKDALVSVQEAGSSTQGFLPRPNDLRIGAHPTRLECVPQDAPLDVYWLSFSDDGRAFYALVAIGKHASSKVTDQTWSTLNSFSTTDTPNREPAKNASDRWWRLPRDWTLAQAKHRPDDLSRSDAVDIALQREPSNGSPQVLARFGLYTNGQHQRAGTGKLVWKGVRAWVVAIRPVKNCPLGPGPGTGSSPGDYRCSLGVAFVVVRNDGKWLLTQIHG